MSNQSWNNRGQDNSKVTSLKKISLDGMSDKIENLWIKMSD